MPVMEDPYTVITVVNGVNQWQTLFPPHPAETRGNQVHHCVRLAVADSCR